WPQVRVARGGEDVHAHVVGVRPDPELRVVEEVGSEVEAVAVPGAGRVAGRRDGDALVSDRNVACGSCELRDDPAVRELVVEDNGIAGSTVLTSTPEAAPERHDVDWAEDRGTGRLVEDL